MKKMILCALFTLSNCGAYAFDVGVDLSHNDVSFSFMPNESFKCRSTKCWDELDYLEVSQGGGESYYENMEFYNSFDKKFNYGNNQIKPTDLRYITRSQWNKHTIHYNYEYSLCDDANIKYCTKKIDFMNELVYNTEYEKQYDLFYLLMDVYINEPDASSKWTKKFYDWKVSNGW